MSDIPKLLCSYGDAETDTITLDLPEIQLSNLDVHYRLAEVAHQFCPMCQSRLRRCIYRSVTLRAPTDPVDGNRVVIDFCEQCGFWFGDEAWYDPYGNDMKETYTTGLVKEYSLDDKTIPLNELRRFLSRHPHHVVHTHPSAFEKLMADCLRSEYGECEVIHMGRTGDGGIDIKLVNSDRETFMIVQVKRRTSLDSTESVQVVRELNGVLFREGLARGMVITTSRSFSAAAVAETIIKTPTRERYLVELRAFSNVCSMLNIKQELQDTYQPWLRHIIMKPTDEEAYQLALKNAPYIVKDTSYKPFWVQLVRSRSR